MEKILVNDEETFKKLCHDLSQSHIFAYDTETNGKVDRFEAQMVGISFAGFDDRAYYLPFMHTEGKQLPLTDCLDYLKLYLEDPLIEKVCHNVKFDEMVLGLHGIDVKGLGNDTIVMAWLLSEKRARGDMKLKRLTEQVFGEKMITYEEIIDSVPRKRGEKPDYNFAKVKLEDALDYAAPDAYWCWRLYVQFKKQLIDEKLWDAYLHVEGPFNRVLGDMEARGVYIDPIAIEYADKKFPEIMEQVEAQIYEQAGEVFDIQSRKQLGHILFEKLRIGIKKTATGEHSNVPRTKTGDYSTAKDTLAIYAPKHKVVENVLRRKKIQKTHSTFVTGTQKHIKKDGKLHPRFNGQGTVTGRLSGSNPNLQQIEGDEVEEIKVRDFFVPSDGFKLVVADYSQVELRVMAHFSRDKYMIEAFESGKDFHDETARGMLKIDEVTHRDRFVAKAINFGVGYGRGAPSVAEQIDCTKKEAQDFIDQWYERFKGVKVYKEHLLKQARQRGYIRTLAGRKRRLLPEIRSDNFKIRGHAERQAFNTKIQGSAADIIKMAMISLHDRLPEIGGYIIIQIHDELVMEIPEDKAEESVVPIKSLMENPLRGKNPLRLPLVVEPKVVERWGDGK